MRLRLTFVQLSLKRVDMRGSGSGNVKVFSLRTTYHNSLQESQEPSVYFKSLEEFSILIIC